VSSRWNGPWNELEASAETNGSEKRSKPEQSALQKPVPTRLSDFARRGLVIRVVTRDGVNALVRADPVHAGPVGRLAARRRCGPVQAEQVGPRVMAHAVEAEVGDLGGGQVVVAAGI
jgi:hypothetical protein